MNFATVVCEVQVWFTADSSSSGANLITPTLPTCLAPADHSSFEARVDTQISAGAQSSSYVWCLKGRDLSSGNKSIGSLLWVWT